MYYVYVLVEIHTGSIYMGYSSNLRERIKKHLCGEGAKYTKKGEWKLVYYESYIHKSDAIKREKRLKRNGGTKNALLKRISQSLACVKVGAGEAHDRSTRKRRP